MIGDSVVSASELRDNCSDILDRVDTARVRVQKYGEDRAYIISVRELRALEETIAILENQN
ncbi:MAG: type II toxin-antitoxin system prevent-host-death family antitoxin, partial [Syntrophobacterales bacterium]